MFKKLLFIFIFFNIVTLSYAEPLKIVVHSYDPFVLETNNGDIDGIVIRRIKEAFCRMNINITFTLKPWNRAYYEAQNNMVDIIAPLYKNASREQIFEYPKNKIAIHQNVIAIRKNFRKLSSTPKDLSILKKS